MLTIDHYVTFVDWFQECKLKKCDLNMGYQKAASDGSFIAKVYGYSTLKLPSCVSERVRTLDVPDMMYVVIDLIKTAYLHGLVRRNHWKGINYGSISDLRWPVSFQLLSQLLSQVTDLIKSSSVLVIRDRFLRKHTIHRQHSCIWIVRIVLLATLAINVLLSRVQLSYENTPQGEGVLTRQLPRHEISLI